MPGPRNTGFDVGQRVGYCAVPDEDALNDLIAADLEPVQFRGNLIVDAVGRKHCFWFLGGLKAWCPLTAVIGHQDAAFTGVVSAGSNRCVVLILAKTPGDERRVAGRAMAFWFFASYAH